MPNINVEVSDEVLKKLRLLCAVMDWTQKDAIEAAIRDKYLHETGQLGEAVGIDMTKELWAARMGEQAEVCMTCGYNFREALALKSQAEVAREHMLRHGIKPPFDEPAEPRSHGSVTEAVTGGRKALPKAVKRLIKGLTAPHASNCICSVCKPPKEKS